ncbi:P63C domain-containing protein [Maridesulfovibrio sp.]|uniref:P63C domain-containing protein n=1 Tax=Maridesulfovibrio sp. TaxID=2795000 RepID=UPI002A18BAB9|nr:P63C domain-containing protein [Maridesulfovibrio sp.]
MPDNMLKATHQGKLNINGNEISCAVLEDETRVLVDRSLALSLDRRGGGAYWRKKKESEAPMLPEYISANYLTPYISEELYEKLLAPIEYTNKRGEVAVGVSAELLPDICNVWITARNDGALNLNQEETAEKAYILLRGLATVGIDALVDEATGYQDIRAKNALAKILEQYLDNELKKWTKTFPDSFYKEIFRLNGWKFNDMSTARPGVIGKWTNDFVYERLAPGLLEELKRKNPKNEKGNRAVRHHQWFNTDSGHPKLRQHIAGVEALMRASTTWEGFKRALDRAYPKLGNQLLLPGVDEEF